MEEFRINNESKNETQEALLREKFDEQFSHFETIPWGESSIEVIDLTPDEITEAVPVLFVPGFGKTPRSYKEALFEIYKSGRRVLSLTAPTDKVELTREEKKNIPTAQAERAYAILHVLQEKRVGEVDVVSHSEGGMNATIAASLAPELFRHFVFVAIPGVTGTQSFLEIAKRGIQNQMQINQEMSEADREAKERYERSNNDIKSWVKERGMLKGAIEATNPGRYEISDEVRKLHNSGHGISIISGVEDKMLPMEEYQRDETGTPRSADDLGVDGFYSIKKGHGELEVNEKVGMLAIHAIEALAQKYSQKDNTSAV